MRLFYGWVIVGVGMVVTCIGMGTMMSLGVFLQPMSQDMGWSRAGISFAAVLNFLAMGFGSFLWGSLSDRFGTRAVVLTGGVLLGFGLRRGEPGGNALPVPAPVRHAGRAGGGQLLCAADRERDALVHRASQPRRGTRLGRHGARLGAGRAAVALDHHQLRLAQRDADARLLSPGWSSFPPRCWCGKPPALAHAAGRGGERRARRTRLHHGAGAAHAAVRRDRAHLLRVLRGALGPDLPHGQLRDRLRHLVDDRGHRVRRHRPRLAERPHRRAG